MSGLNPGLVAQKRKSQPARLTRLELTMLMTGVGHVELARALGISRQSFWSIRTGKTKAFNRWENIALILKVSLEWLIHGTGPQPEWVQELLHVVGELSSENKTEIEQLRRRLDALEAAGA